ncbi:MAG: phosphoribosylanthranilate isomerase [Chloroflexi bacterium]|nr:phosphoribosylanthranilate isomerase [Chloroflexota bacterium]
MVRVKICGITNLDDALAAVEYGADALGFVFAPSPRRVTPEKVKRIVKNLPPFVCKVGVFVNSEIEFVKKTMAACNLDLAQLHGNETPDYCAALSPKAIKMFTKNNLPPDKKLGKYRVAAYMLDKDKNSKTNEAEQKKLWKLAGQIGEHAPVILAGGLTPDNVSEAIKIARPYAVDVSSGIESKPGVKDHAKMREFLKIARGVNNG